MKELLDLIKASLWPLFALVALVLFYAPIHTALDSIAKRADRIQELNLGGLKLSIRADELPKADNNVAEALQNIDDQGVRALLAFSSDDTRWLDCPQNQRQHQGFLSAEKSGLLEKEGGGSPSSDCPSSINWKLTEVGRDTRAYLFRFVSQAFGGGTSAGPVKTTPAAR